MVGDDLRHVRGVVAVSDDFLPPDELPEPPAAGFVRIAHPDLDETADVHRLAVHIYAERGWTVVEDGGEEPIPPPPPPTEERVQDGFVRIAHPDVTGTADVHQTAVLFYRARGWTPVAELPPPRGGAGSDRGTWAEHAAALGVEVTEEMNRDDIVAAVDEAQADREVVNVNIEQEA
jgi:hypothetical protein